MSVFLVSVFLHPYGISATTLSLSGIFTFRIGFRIRRDFRAQIVISDYARYPHTLFDTLIDTLRYLSVVAITYLPLYGILPILAS